MKLPCEEALWYVLPQIRADLARELVKNGSSQKEVAELLGLTPSAVSQYLHKKRGGKFKTAPGYKGYLKKMAKEIKETKSQDEISTLICKCCAESRSKAGK
jgi:predicted transcriptional regulator